VRTRRLMLAPAVAAFFVLAAGPVARGADPAQAQKERLDTMKAINQAMRELKVYTGKGDFPQVLAAANRVAGLVAKIPSLSPEGSNVGKTRIKPEVWKNFGHYKELAETSVQAARALAGAAGKKDRAAVAKAFAALGDSCKTCHDPYRLPKKED